VAELRSRPNVVMIAGGLPPSAGIRGMNTTVTTTVSAESAWATGPRRLGRAPRRPLAAGGWTGFLALFYFESLTRFRALSPSRAELEAPGFVSGYGRWWRGRGDPVLSP
jgi:hypothetical protein